MLIRRVLCHTLSTTTIRSGIQTRENKSIRMLHVITLPCSERSRDNYMYIIADEKSKEAAAVDPLEPQRVKQAVQKAGLDLKAVLTTHHHWDHAGGNEEMRKLFPSCEIYGESKVASLTKKAEHGDKISIGGLLIECLHTPCHTEGHICYYVTSQSDPSHRAVFTGDTLFLGGCGKFFEGTASQMHASLNGTLGSLPDDTLVYCGHEYLLSNLKYAKFAEPSNVEIDKKIEWCSANPCTVPGRIGEEKKYNPFMRVNEISLQKRANSTDPIEVMKFLREEKNSFKC